MQDRIVAILETAERPIKYWDVKRQLDESSRWPVSAGSVKVWLATDTRTCWAGPGAYGLYRHGLLPGVRDLGSAAAVFIHAAKAFVDQYEARFVLQDVGYRFESTSIYVALRRAEDLGLLWRAPGFGREILWTGSRRVMGPVLRLSRHEDIDPVMARAAAQAVTAFAEWERTHDD